MTVLKWSALFALAIALAASPAMAEETPHATVLDHRVREANYNDRQVYEIRVYSASPRKSSSPRMK
jgi:type IV secretion system protein VirB9